MNYPPPPPPPEPSGPPPVPARKSYTGLIVACSLIGLVMIVGIVTGVTVFVKQQVVKREEIAKIEKSAAEERVKMADSIRDGNLADGNASLGRIKDQLGQSATHLSGADAAATRAMANYLGKIQANLQNYSTEMDKLMQAKVLSFDISDRATIEQHRQIIRDFLAANAKLIDILQHGEDLLRAELEAEKVPPFNRDQTLQGYQKSQAELRPLQMRVRQCDQTLGESALAVLDLLDKNWGKWERNEASGRLRFQDDATLSSFNDLVKKIQAAAADQEKAQREMIAKVKPTGGH
ncbi:hypothetical protein [Chthoniobacter flavus]|nr:hypothetical protein [Chthoniobacter flavus]